MTKRVLIIGLDGFTWDLGDDFIHKSVMPHLSGLAESGTHGVLNSVFPSETAPAWTSFQTGCLPGKTGVFAFHYYDRQNQRLAINSYLDIKVPTLWELAHQAGKKVVSLNLPMTSPPPQIDGVIIPGLLCPQLSAQTVHPHDAWQKYVAACPDYKIINTELTDTVAQFVDQQIATEKTRADLALRLMGDIDWDIFCLQIQSTDHAQHHLWSVIDPQCPGHRPSDRPHALRFYQAIDEIIGSLAGAAGSDTLVLLVSDHGFTRLDFTININAWLRKHNYLKLTPKAQRTLNKNSLKNLVPGLRPLARLYGRLLSPAHTDTKPESILARLQQAIDIPQSSAFALGALGGLIYLNNTHANPQALAQEITTKLIADLGPQSHSPLISQIMTGAEAFPGLAPENAPNLVLQYAQGTLAHLECTSTTVTQGPASLAFRGTHSPQGVLLCAGPQVKAAEKLDGDIVDILPTILAYLGIAVPRHVDGKVLTGLFHELPPISYHDTPPKQARSVAYSDQEQAHLQKQLTDLGYL